MSPMDLLPRQATLAALIEQESELRKQFLVPEPTREEIVGLLSRCAGFLELQLLLVGITEAAVICELRRAADLPRCAQRMFGIARGLTGLDLEVVVKEHQRDLRHDSQGPLPPEFDPKTIRDGLVRQAHASVVSCPIDELVHLGEVAGRPDLSHRGRMAWERLRAAIRRSSAAEDPRLPTLGVAYAEGRLALEEVVTLMAMRPEDVVELLERFGYARHIETIRTAPDLQRRLQAARDDRLRRKGRPDPDPSLLGREVIATQRIEDVDARPWVPIATDS